MKCKYEILSEICLSSMWRARIDGVVDGTCECGNCKIKVRQHRKLPKDAWHGHPRSHDYVYDVEEVLNIKKKIIK